MIMWNKLPSRILYTMARLISVLYVTVETICYISILKSYVWVKPIPMYKSSAEELIVRKISCAE